MLMLIFCQKTSRFLELFGSVIYVNVMGIFTKNAYIACQIKEHVLFRNGLVFHGIFHDL